MPIAQRWSNEDAQAQAEAIRRIEAMQQQTLQSRLVGNVAQSLEVQLQAERQARVCAEKATAELRSRLEAQEAELRVTRKALELRYVDHAKAQREVRAVMLQQAGAPLGSPEQERIASLQAQVAALHAECRLKDVQLARYAGAAAAGSAASNGKAPAARRLPGSPDSEASTAVGRRLRGGLALARGGDGRLDLRAGDADYDEVASVVLGYSDDDAESHSSSGSGVLSNRLWC